MGEWTGTQQQGRRLGPTSRYPRKKYGRPPPSPSGSWQQTIPLWEKKFCTDVCLIPWRKLCETKKVMSMYENVVRWDDSAGEEAFRDAKARFWAEINGLPCHIPLPDPEMYIDEVNQETYINPQLLEDLYEPPPIYNANEVEESCGWDSFMFADRPVPVSGWGDIDDFVPNVLLGS
ncbi:hypothetical protein Cni_G09268 [Canna indica]|uniref:Uncharacterized protein n=1 Tax=Canna indica TaxID=4628 RepID=A0AAQ3Q9G4_9LILI|nr:hypothetical protein Cni_G09268 [Canna indica]